MGACLCIKYKSFKCGSELSYLGVPLPAWPNFDPFYVSPPNNVPSDTCPWQVGWHQPQNSTDSCFSIPEEVLVEESWRKADSVVNFRICLIPFSTQPRCLCLKARLLWVLLWTSVSFSSRAPKGKWLVCQWKSFILTWNKGPFIFPTILRHFHAARVEKVKTRIHT